MPTVTWTFSKDAARVSGRSLLRPRSLSLGTHPPDNDYPPPFDLKPDRSFLKLHGSFCGLLDLDLIAGLDSCVGLRDKHVNGRHHKERESGADDHSTYQHDANAVSRSSAWALGKNERKMA